MRFALENRHRRQVLEYLFPQAPTSPYLPSSVTISIKDDIDLFDEKIDKIHMINMPDSANYHHAAVEILYTKGVNNQPWKYKAVVMRGAHAEEDNYNYRIPEFFNTPDNNYPEHREYMKLVDRWPTFNLTKDEHFDSSPHVIIPFAEGDPRLKITEKDVSTGKDQLREDVPCLPKGVTHVQNGNEIVLNTNPDLSRDRQQLRMNKRFNKRRIPNWDKNDISQKECVIIHTKVTGDIIKIIQNFMIKKQDLIRNDLLLNLK